MNSEIISVPCIFVISSFLKKTALLTHRMKPSSTCRSSHSAIIITLSSISSAIWCSLRLAMASNAVIAKAILKFPPVSAEALSAVLQLLSSLGSWSLISLFILSIRSWSLVRLTLDQLGQPEFCASLLFTVHVHSLNTVCHLHFGQCSTQLCLEEPTLLAAPNVTKVVYRFFRVG